MIMITETHLHATKETLKENSKFYIWYNLFFFWKCFFFLKMFFFEAAMRKWPVGCLFTVIKTFLKFDMVCRCKKLDISFTHPVVMDTSYLLADQNSRMDRQSFSTFPFQWKFHHRFSSPRVAPNNMPLVPTNNKR